MNKKQVEKQLTDSQRDAFDNTPKRSNIQIDAYKQTDFNLNGFTLSTLFDDFILVRYVDINNTGEVIRNGIVINTNHSTYTWRIAEVLLAGINCKQVKEGDLVVFPNDKGITVSNIEVKNHGVVKDCKFLNEERIFGIVERNES